jgi:hypothetical protein
MFQVCIAELAEAAPQNADIASAAPYAAGFVLPIKISLRTHPQRSGFEATPAGGL